VLSETRRTFTGSLRGLRIAKVGVCKGGYLKTCRGFETIRCTGLNIGSGKSVDRSKQLERALTLLFVICRWPPAAHSETSEDSWS
jgi:hypothetical protein